MAKKDSEPVIPERVSVISQETAKIREGNRDPEKMGAYGFVNMVQRTLSFLHILSI